MREIYGYLNGVIPVTQNQPEVNSGCFTWAGYGPVGASFASVVSNRSFSPLFLNSLAAPIASDNHPASISFQAVISY
jgi:hypothetical protein